MLDINSSLEFDRIESYQRRLAVHPDDTQLRVATNLDNWRVGGQAALIHLLANWAARFEKPQLVLHAPTETEALDQGLTLGNTHHGLMALLAASDVLLSSRTALAPKQREMLVNDLLASAYPLSAKREIPGIWKGARALFLCSHRHDKDFIPHLYHFIDGQDPEVKSSSDFRTLFSKVINELRGHNKAVSNPPIKTQNDVGDIIHELFKNTHEHGMLTVGGNRTNNSLRGILVAFHTKAGLHDLNLVETLKDSPVKDYVARFDALDEARERTFLEINIFDNGPGIAVKWLNRPIEKITVEQEWKAVQDCWAKNATTSPRQRKGLGLYRVARTLSECGGFLRIRTGRFSLYRDFFAHEYPDGSIDPSENLFTTPSLTLMDFKTRSQAYRQASPLAACEGLLLTMLIPMERLDSLSSRTLAP